MRHFGLAVPVLLFMACKTSSTSTLRQEEVGLPRYQVRHADTKMTIDGRLSEPAWRNANELRMEFPWAQQPVKESTVARLLWDEAHLYVAYDNVDHFVQAQVKDHDGMVFKDDCVEIFVSPDENDVSRYVAFEINALGTMLDYTAAEAGNGPTKSFNYPWQSEGVELKATLKEKTTLNDNKDMDLGWILEMKIPLQNFAVLRKEPSDAPRVWRANLNRCKGPERGEWATWSPTRTEKPNFHLSAFFGYLDFLPRGS